MRWQRYFALGDTIPTGGHLGAGLNTTQVNAAVIVDNADVPFLAILYCGTERR
ncbi:hypothetical protein D3C80_2017170 [compost metagenome]